MYDVPKSLARKHKKHWCWTPQWLDIQNTIGGFYGGLGGQDKKAFEHLPGNITNLGFPISLILKCRPPAVAKGRHHCSMRMSMRLGFPEIRIFSLLNHHVGWGRVRSLFQAPWINNGWNNISNHQCRTLRVETSSKLGPTMVLMVEEKPRDIIHPWKINEWKPLKFGTILKRKG